MTCVSIGSGVGEKGQGVDEVAHLADDPPAALLAVDPALRRDCAGVHPVEHHERLGAVRKQLLGLADQRREAAVEADHQDPVRALGRGDDRVQLLAGGGQRLFDEDVLAGFQRLDGQRRVGVMAGGNEDDVGVRVGQNLPRLGRRIGKAELPRRVLAAEPGRGHHAGQADAGLAPDFRQQHRLGEVPGADEADAERPGLRCDRPRGQIHPPGRFAAVVGIAQDDPDVGLLPVDQRVGLLGLRDAEAMGDERGGVTLPSATSSRNALMLRRSVQRT